MDAVIKSIISFGVLLLLTRLLGKKQMNQITYFDYIAGITLGSIAGNVSVEPHISVVDGIYSLLVWSALTFLLSFITQKSYMLRNFFDGQPDIIIKNGKILEDRIKKAHLNMDDVTMLLREKEIFSVSDVEYAILEPHGKLSVIKKSILDTVTKKDMNIANEAKACMPTDLIIDGKIIYKNLAEIKKDINWLKNELANQGYSFSDIKNIFYSAIQENGNLYISSREQE